MNAPLQHLEADLATLRSVWAGASAVFDPALAGGLRAAGGLSRTGELPPAGELSLVGEFSDAGLVRVTDAVGRLLRDAEAVLTQVAGEVARRSPSELGRDGLAKKHGFGTAARMVAASTGGSVAAATRAVTVGTATALGLSLTGETLPAAHPQVAAAVASGSISVEAAAAITTMLDRVAPRADADDAVVAERLLAEKAEALPLDLLIRVIRQVEARLDPDGVGPREEDMRADRFLSMREDAHGMLHLKGCLDPATGAPVKAAIEAAVTHTIRATRNRNAAGAGAGADDDGDGDGRDGDAGGPVVADPRTILQMQADALAMIAAHVIGCQRVPEVAATTLVIRANLDALVEGVGHGTIDGLTQPVSAGTIRRLAASAGIIPVVLGTDSLPLDLGRTARLFTPAQRIALAERDGGCASCGLDVAYTEAHHIHWWKRDTGPTDLTNGVLLCPPCHTRIHEDGWSIRIDDHHQVWFTPPPHVDSEQTPRPGGKTRFDIPHVA